jgi:oxygen-independent coproporphyrinogen-3 oxidase
VSVETVQHLPVLEPSLLERLSRPGPRYTSYPTAPEWTDAVGPAELRRHLALADGEGASSPLSLYFHIPFCRNMCTYCGCNVVVARRQDRADLYLGYLERELELVCAELPRRRSVTQLHLGGGTPTFLDLGQLERLWSAIVARFRILPGAEVALEIDPVVTSSAQLDLLRGLGFNRVSMGVQDFTPEVQEYVGRVQPLELTREIYQHARRLGFRGINFDLIYGLPRQRPETFRRTVEQVVEMGPDRVAVFSYAHVPWMRPHQRRFDEKLIPQAAEKFQLFALAHRLLLEAGYIQIGMDHFARPDDELAMARLERRLKRNFQGYTVNPASDLLAFGITGISDVQGCYAQSLKTLPHYYRRLERGELPVERGWVLSDEDRLRRRLINEIMCNFYLDLEAVCAPLGIDARQRFAGELERLREPEELGLLRRRDLVLELTALGRVLPRNVAMVFDPYLRKRAGKPTFSRTI